MKRKCNRNTNIFLIPKRIAIFSNTKMMVILSFLIAIRLFMQFFSIYIPQFSMSISISWTPLMIIGWFFGPLIGFTTGLVTDTIAYLIKPSGQWFWLYAIQEPLVGLLSGVVGLLSNLSYKINQRNQLKPTNYDNKLMFKNIEFIIMQLVLIAFVFLFLFTMIYWVDDDAIFQGSKVYNNIFYSSYKYVLIAMVIFFFIVIECFFIFFILKNKKNMLINFCYVSILVISCTFIFSFILGPISSVEYFKYINNGREPNSFIKYGSIYYLIPRIIKEAIKAPLQIVILCLCLPIINFNISKAKKEVTLKWSSNN